MTVFVSQPFIWYDLDEIFELRNQVIQFLVDEGVLKEGEFDIITQYDEDTEHKQFEHLANDILMIGTADLVVFVPGWEKARECRVEMTLCKAYGIPYKQVFWAWR